MCWAGAMIMFNKGTDLATAPTLMVGIISETLRNYRRNPLQSLNRLPITSEIQLSEA